jgi:hypothetical protein
MAVRDVIPVTHRTRKRNTGHYVGSEGTHRRYDEPVATRIETHTASADRSRTLAWHIARRPNGLVALAVQYGHLRTTFVSEGYASRSRGGIHDLIDVETVFAVADTVSNLHDHLKAPTRAPGCSVAQMMRSKSES